MRLGDDIPAHQAPRRQIDISVGRLPGPSWKRPLGRPRSKWLDQIRSLHPLICGDVPFAAVVTAG